MKRFYKENPDELTPEEWQLVRSGDWYAEPKRGMVYDHGDALYARHIEESGMYNDGMSFRDKAKWFMLGLLFLVFAIAMYQGGVW